MSIVILPALPSPVVLVKIDASESNRIESVTSTDIAPPAPCVSATSPVKGLDIPVVAEEIVIYLIPVITLLECELFVLLTKPLR